MRGPGPYLKTHNFSARVSLGTESGEHRRLEARRVGTYLDTTWWVLDRGVATGGGYIGIYSLPPKSVTVLFCARCGTLTSTCFEIAVTIVKTYTLPPNQIPGYATGLGMLDGIYRGRLCDRPSPPPVWLDNFCSVL